MSAPKEMATRDGFGAALMEAAGQNESIVVVSCDLAEATRVQAFSKAYPSRFFEIGIAEQNGIGIAAGLALSGLRPFICSFGAFIASRYDQIRISCAYNKAGVVIVGTHSGLAIGKDGATQMGLEDLNLMSAVPGMHIYQPADVTEAAQIVAHLAQSNELAYLRLSRTPHAAVLPPNYVFQFNKATTLRDGTDIALLATGDTVLSAMQSSDFLAAQDVSAAVVNFSTLKPIDTEAIAYLANSFPLLVTVEDHNTIGGLGSRVAEIMAEVGGQARLVRLGVPDCFGESGSPTELYKKYGLDAVGIATKAQAALGKPRRPAPAHQPAKVLIRSPKPMVSYHVVTWNRLNELQNMLRSFIACNQYENFEWIVVDHGSIDGTVEFLQNIGKNPTYKYLWGRAKTILVDDRDYVRELKERGIEINSPRRAAQAFFGKYRNDARRLASGDYFIDIPDDHQFIRKSDWISEMLAIYNDRIQKEGRDDISSLVFKTRRLFRILKRNQATGPRQVVKLLADDLENANNVEYYVCRFKGYDDYGMISRTMAEQMGPYWQIDTVTDPSTIMAWNDPDNFYFRRTSPHYEHYLARARSLNLKKIMVKYPYTHDLMNDHRKIPKDAFAVPLTTAAALRRKFFALHRPVSFEELENLLTGEPSSWPLFKTKVEAQARALIH